MIYAGRYSPYKGIDMAVRALARVKKDYPDAKLWVIGKKDQDYVDKNLMPICRENHLIWEDAATDDPMGDIVSWGYVSEEKKLELLSRAWVLLFPSIREGWGIPITEAGCVGTPCVAFDSPGIREAVNYGKAGFLCVENSVNGLVAQICMAISDKMVYSSKRDSAYQYSSQFQWDEAGKELERFIDGL